MARDIKQQVRSLLERYPWTRCSDNELYAMYLTEKGLSAMPIGKFLNSINDYGVANLESIGRVRRKVQEEHPELQATDKIREARAELEKEYREAMRH